MSDSASVEGVSGTEAMVETADDTESQPEAPGEEASIPPTAQAMAAVTPVDLGTGKASMIHTFDAEWQNHPLYLFRINNAIRDRWTQLNASVTLQVEQPIDEAKVSIRFILAADGTVREAEIVETSIGLDLAAQLCRDAVLSSGPFPAFSKDMIADFGESVSMQMQFVY